MKAAVTFLSERSLTGDASLAPAIDAIASAPGVERIVCGVDLHRKARAESPSSVAVASVSRVYPKLTSVAANCGMSLLRTSLSREDLTDGRLDELFRRWRRSDAETFTRPPVTLEEMRAIVSTGARAAIGPSGLDPSSLENVEFGGCIGEPETLPWSAVLDVVPRSTLERGRRGFGVVPAGNHFIELQYVEEIVDASWCERFGLRPGGVLVMLHADGGLVSDDLGNLYADRSVTRGAARALYGARRIALHLAGVPPAIAAERRRIYFSRDPLVSIDPGAPEGRRCLEAMRFAMNTGYASRVAAAGRLSRVIEGLFAGGTEPMKILCDFSHNSILREDVGGRSFWVHRHNAARVLPGRLVFLPGSNCTSSYVCRGGPGAAETIFTMDHGAGKTIDRLRAEGRLRSLGPERVTRAYDNVSEAPAIVPHLSDEGVDEVVRALAERDIAHPVARVRPVAGYRFHWKGRLARLVERIVPRAPRA